MPFKANKPKATKPDGSPEHDWRCADLHLFIFLCYSFIFLRCAQGRFKSFADLGAQWRDAPAASSFSAALPNFSLHVYAGSSDSLSCFT
mmetsp:Transcript_20631/g.33005  ORF Transcript_20631/g.33005 Transcript_20631/m.33005 type:complete len:89 (+) Transcript_20631:1105-1371(+)